MFTDKTLKPAAIAGHRTAITDHLSTFDISKNLELNRLLASFHRHRPVKDKAIPNWDLSLVLLALTKPPFEGLIEDFDFQNSVPHDLGLWKEDRGRSMHGH